MLTKNESLSSAGKNLMYKEYYYGIFLMMLNKKWESRIPTLAVGLKGMHFELLINEDFWMSRPEEIQVGALKHECLHLIHFHLTDFNHLEDQKIANWAMDIEINQYIADENREDEWLTPDRFPELNLELKMGTNYYYEKLMEAKEAGNKNLQAMMDALENGEDQCQLPGTGQTVDIPNHDWEVFKALPEAAQRMIQRQTEYVIKEAADAVTKSQGHVPGEIASILEKINTVEPPKYDWRGHMRRFVGRSTQVITRKTRRKQSKRFPENPGIKLKKKKNILMAWDTSGSFSDEELIESQHEGYHLVRTGAEVTMIQADAAISYIGKFDPKKEVAVHGRGGTSFQPVIDYYNENLHKYSCLIYFTDGEAGNPVNVKGNVLWVLSSQSSMNHDLNEVGTVIQLN
jgi:predicted metal-dependent peptidase